MYYKKNEVNMVKINSNMSVIIAFLLFCVFSGPIHAQIFNGADQSLTNLEALADHVQPGTVLVIGEMHGLPVIKNQHLELLEALKNKNLIVSVGLEFLNYTDQDKIDQYRLGLLDEDSFLKTIRWGGYDFNLYKDQLLFGQYGLGINLSRDITKIISKQGIQGLSVEQARLLPPQFTVGRDSYRDRFFKAMGHPVPISSMENYFVAQSAWDDTMAWQAVQFIKSNPNHIFVIIVGEFHVQYGGGLPDRLKQRLGAENLFPKIMTVSQVYTKDMTANEIADSLKPSAEEGPRADFIWLSK